MNSFSHIAPRASTPRSSGRSRSGSRAAQVEQHTYDFDVAHRDADAAAREGGGGRLPLLPGARPRPRRAACRARRAPPRASCPSCPPTRIRRVGGERSTTSGALVLVTGGLDALWEATVAAGADAVAAANVVANQLVGAGVDPGAVDAERARRSSSTRASGSRGRRSTRRSRTSATPGFAAEPLPRAGGRLGRGCARADRRRDPRREPGAGRAVPRRQGGAARLLRRPGDEGDEGPGGRSRGQRARPGEALGVDNRSAGALRSALCPSRRDRDQRRGATSCCAQPRDAARGAPLADHAGRASTIS